MYGLNITRRFLIACFCASLGWAFQGPGPQVLDFIPPVGSSNPDALRAVSDPGSITVEKNPNLSETKDQQVVTRGASTQDAINTVANDLKPLGKGAGWISTPSGLGAVVVGAHDYDISGGDADWVALKQREASVRAHMKAQANLLEFLKGLKMSGRRYVYEQVVQADTLQNIESSSEETINEHVLGILRGVVMYDYHDDPGFKTDPPMGRVVVTLVTTPLTQGQVRQVDGDTLRATSGSAGLESVFAQIRAGVVPPDGGRTVVADEGTVVWVGFGSSLIPSESLAPAMSLNAARRQAESRAKIRLLGLIKGETVEMQGSSADDMSEIIKTFEIQVSESGLQTPEKLQDPEIRRFRSFANSQAIESLVEGQLPPGVITRTYETEDGRWAYAVSVWFQQSTVDSQKLAGSMRSNSPLGNLERRTTGFETNPDGSFQKDEKGAPIPRSLGKGQVTKKKDL
ncbi:MAG: hypothetical protein GY711_09940 [bacterium]|nr:hypothetical protein [bacterium]